MLAMQARALACLWRRRRALHGQGSRNVLRRWWQKTFWCGPFFRSVNAWAVIVRNGASARLSYPPLPEADAPCTLENVYGEVSNCGSSAQNASLFVPVQAVYTSSKGGGLGRSTRVEMPESRRTWVAERVFAAYMERYCFDPVIVYELRLNVDAVILRQLPSGGNVEIAYRDGSRFVFIFAASSEPFAPGNPLCEAVRAQAAN